MIYNQASLTYTGLLDWWMPVSPERSKYHEDVLKLYQKLNLETFFEHTSSNSDIKTFNIPTASNNTANTAESQDTVSFSFSQAQQWLDALVTNPPPMTLVSMPQSSLIIPVFPSHWVKQYINCSSVPPAVQHYTSWKYVPDTKSSQLAVLNEFLTKLTIRLNKWAKMYNFLYLNITHSIKLCFLVLDWQEMRYPVK